MLTPTRGLVHTAPYLPVADHGPPLAFKACSMICSRRVCSAIAVAVALAGSTTAFFFASFTQFSSVCFVNRVRDHGGYPASPATASLSTGKRTRRARRGLAGARRQQGDRL